MFAASAGGHLDLLRAIAPDVLGTREPIWVTSSTPRGEQLRDAAAQVELLPEYGRSASKAVENVVDAARLVARRRPRTVVTSGAGVVAPFCLLARLAGARIVYVETMARVSSPSKTARLLSLIANRVLVQWPELADHLPRAEVCRPTLLEGIADAGAWLERPRSGTVIAVGTHAQPFTRLLEIATRGIEDGLLPGPVLAQVGPADWTADGAHVAAYMSGEKLDAAVRSSELGVCHAGAGIISAALAGGHRPIVIPRRARLGEHVDDHQDQLTRRLGESGLVVHVEDRITDGMSRRPGGRWRCRARSLTVPGRTGAPGGAARALGRRRPRRPGPRYAPRRCASSC